MKIVVNFKATGMANNGGTRTLVRCAEVLSELGHDVALYSPGRCAYSWHKPAVPIVRGDRHPKCDVMIASGWGSWGHVIRSKAKKKTVYVRGWETWNASEKKLIATLKQFDAVYANSQWQVDHMRDHDIDAQLVYPGMDTHWFKELGLTRSGVGALMHNKNKNKRSQDAVAVEERLKLKFQYLNRHIKRPDSPSLNKWYNGLCVWLATPELEGLHNPPIEASLAGVAVVATDHPRSGMQDYLVDGETALLYPARNVKAAAKRVKMLLDDASLRSRLVANMRALLMERMGTRRDAMARFGKLLAR